MPAPPHRALTEPSFARIFFLLVTRLSLNRPFLVFAHMCVKPRNSNVSGFRSPRLARFSAAHRPNSISRVFSGSTPNRTPRACHEDQQGIARHRHDAQNPPRSRRRTAKGSRLLARDAAATARPTDRTRSEGRRSRATEKPKPPARVPSAVPDHSPSSMTPALSHFWISRRTLLSAIRCSRNLSIQP